MATPARCFVGRRRERAQLAAALAGAQAGRGGVVLLAGEPGIGKTWLASEVADEALAQGVRVVWGRCWEGSGTPSLWPWMQIVRALAASASDAALRAWLGRGGPDLAEVLPELRERFGDLPASPPLQPEQARFRLLESAAAFLERAAAAQPPLLVILDDLHWADELSLLLGRFLARSARQSPLLLLGTYRRVEARQTAEGAALIDGLARDAAVVLPLEGLSAPEVREYLRATLPSPPSPSLVSVVHARTDGNPLFVAEVARVMPDDATAAAATFEPPPELVATIARRAEALSPAARQCLRLAAVIGREVDVALLRAMAAPLERSAIDAALQEAAAAGILVAGASDRVRFGHDLMREALYRDLPAGERRALHGWITDHLETRGDGRGGDALSALAHHACAAAGDGSGDARAIAYAVRAAERAAGRYAAEEAVRHYDRALGVLGTSPAVADRRVALLMARGDAQWAAGQPENGRATFATVASLLRPGLQAAADAETARRFATAALGYSGPGLGMMASATGPLSERILALLDEALAAIGEADSPLRARLLGRRALAMSLARDAAQRIATSQQAIAVARRCGDTATLIAVLLEAHWGGWSPENVHQRLARSAEVIALATAAGDAQSALAARAFRLPDLLEIADVARATREMVAHAALAEELRHPFHRYAAIRVRTAVAIMQGHFAEAAALLHETLAAGERVDAWLAGNTFAGQALVLALLRGRPGDVVQQLEAVAGRQPDLPDWRAALALLYWQLGRQDAARQAFAFLAADEFAIVSRGFPMLLVTALLAELCVELGDRERAATLYDRLRGHSGKMIILGAMALYGSADRVLGRLAALLGRAEAAREHFERALALEGKAGARPTLAATQYAYAALLAEGPDAEPARARALLGAAGAAAEEMGMEALASAVRALAERLASATAAAPVTVAGNVFRRTATGWSIVFGGVAVELRDRKGLRYIAELLREPDRACHVAALVALLSAAPERVGRLADAQRGGVSAIPDARARAAYRVRIEELRDELAEAERNHDVGRTAPLRDELERLGDELSAAVGWGAQRAAANGAVEKMRKAVLAAIRNALRDIARAHPAASRHLEKSLATGVFCVYQPEQPTRWLVE